MANDGAPDPTSTPKPWRSFPKAGSPPDVRLCMPKVPRDVIDRALKTARRDLARALLDELKERETRRRQTIRGYRPGIWPHDRIVTETVLLCRDYRYVAACIAVILLELDDSSEQRVAETLDEVRHGADPSARKMSEALRAKLHPSANSAVLADLAWAFRDYGKGVLLTVPTSPKTTPVPTPVTLAAEIEHSHAALVSALDKIRDVVGVLGVAGEVRGDDARKALDDALCAANGVRDGLAAGARIAPASLAAHPTSAEHLASIVSQAIDTLRALAIPKGRAHLQRLAEELRLGRIIAANPMRRTTLERCRASAGREAQEALDGNVIPVDGFPGPPTESPWLAWYWSAPDEAASVGAALEGKWERIFDFLGAVQETDWEPTSKAIEVGTTLNATIAATMPPSASLSRLAAPVAETMPGPPPVLVAAPPAKSISAVGSAADKPLELRRAAGPDQPLEVHSRLRPALRAVAAAAVDRHEDPGQTTSQEHPVSAVPQPAVEGLGEVGPSAEAVEAAKRTVAGEDEVSPAGAESLPERQPLNTAGFTAATNAPTHDLLIARLGAHGRPAAAYFATRAARNLSPDAVHWDPTLWKALSLARFVTSAHGELVHELRAAVDEHAVWCLDHDEGELRGAGGLVRLAAAIRPSLLAPVSNVVALLDNPQDVEQLRPLADLVEVLRKNATQGFELTPALLSGAQTGQRQHDDLERHRQLVARWWQDRRRATLKFQATTQVWRTWLSDDGMIGRLLNIVVEDSRSSADHLRTELSRLKTDVIRQEMMKTDHERRGRKDPIVGEASKHLVRVTQEGLDLCDAWLSLISLGSRPDYLQQAADQVRRDFLLLLPGARAHLDRLAAEETMTSFSARIAAAGLDEMERLLSDGSFPTASVAPSLAMIIDLLPQPQVELRPDREPDAGPHDLLAQLDAASTLRFPWGEQETWVQAFGERESRRDSFACAVIVNEVMPSIFGDVPASEALALRLRRLSDDCSLEVDRRRAEVGLQVQRAAIGRIISESEAREFELIVAATGSTDVMDNIGCCRGLDRVEAQLDEVTATRTAELRAEASSIERTAPESYGRIAALLDDGDVATAHEYIEITRRGHPLPDGQWVEPDPILNLFWPTFVEEYTKGTASIADCQRHLEKGVPHGVFTKERVTSELFEDAAQLLERWGKLRTTATAGDMPHAARHLRDLLQLLGFQAREGGGDSVTGVPGDARRKYLVCDAQFRTVSSKRSCLVSTYGSQAQGRYRIILSWDPTRPPDGLIELAREHQRRDAPTILIALQPLKAAEREQLSRRSRDRNARRTLLVLDEVLVAFLATRPTSERLAALTRCGFPFTWVDPYSATAGMVPVEVFYGRAKEYAQIVDPTGSCLVYGGRQLGKTALLKHVERTVNDRAHGVIVKYVDLKAEQLGLMRPTTQIWNVISSALHEFGICSANVGAETFKEKARVWLDQAGGRRIVLLLDEADMFFQKDGSEADENGRTAAKSFPDVWTLKSFMEQTDRRFKVVFAGLHNVQRMARDPNSPLAHLGTPICVGPLFGDDQEWNDARDLVTEPLRTAGFSFESPDTVMRILAHCNYYPSLIQLFCKELLEHLNRKLLEKGARPPFKVRVSDVDEAYSRSELRRAILDRFQWTLDLDLRYKLVALLIAFESGVSREALRSGFSIEDIRSWALGWWSKGFADDASFDHFRVLLEEMIGLGILRHVGENRFTLRNPNVLGLLGTDAEIEQQLDDVAHAEPPIEYEPSTFRRDLRTDDGRRSALTAKQEATCFERKSGVVLLFGHDLSGLKDVRRSLAQVERTDEVKELAFVEAKSRDEFRRMLEGHEQAILVVTDDVPWDPTWVEVAVGATRNRRQRWLRIVLVGGPARAWEWCVAIETRKAIGEYVAHLGLSPWGDPALRKWLEDHQLVSARDPESRRDVLAQTGGLPELLYAVARDCKDRPQKWREAVQKNVERVVPLGGELFGLEARRQTVLKNLAALGRATVEELAAVSELSEDKVGRVLMWAEWLGYLRVEEGGARSVLPLVARFLGA